ncbi:ankyrin repeat protein [Xylariaceae sp. FL1019]|nr:ankyrin repeat protein [Xylariaceae sp. FL1019]
MGEEVVEGASVKERLVEACRRDNVDLLNEIISQCKSDTEITDLLNNTTSVMGNHLYHEAALQGNYDIIDTLLDQPDFECDPINRVEGDTPLHSAIRWINSKPAEREFGNQLVEMMLEAGSSTRVKNKNRLTPIMLVDPGNQALRKLIQTHEYRNQNAGDFVDESAKDRGKKAVQQQEESDDDAEFSGSDEEERAEWERRRKAKR